MGNICVSLHNALSPSVWEPLSTQQQPMNQNHRIETWISPVSGTYEYIPGSGWFLISPHEENLSTVAVRTREQVTYCPLLERWMFQSDIWERTRWAEVKVGDGKRQKMGFFQLDDGISWARCWDEDARCLKGPWDVWIWDEATGQMRRKGVRSVGSPFWKEQFHRSDELGKDLSVERSK